MSGTSAAVILRENNLQSISLNTPVVKASKFKPSMPTMPDAARRPALQSFSTPGFQSNPSSKKTRRDIVYVSSDSTPPTPSLKRDSSDLSMAGMSPHVSKRQKKLANEEKENLLRISAKVNMAPERLQLIVPRKANDGMRRVDFNSDLISLSAETLHILKSFVLSELVRIQEDCLAYHHGSTAKDIVLLEAEKDLVYQRRKAIETRLEALNANTMSSIQQPQLPEPAIMKQSTSPALQKREESVVILDDPLPTPGHVAVVEDCSDDEYWGRMDDITMDEAVVASAAATTTSMSGSNASSSTTFPEVIQKLRDVFRLKSFRKNQQEAIVATLEGKDVFVLMPTGGGKSLCYQLPAVCTTGRTQGVTVVVSPLLALMKDQIDSLHKKCIDALLTTSETVADVWQTLITSNSKPSLWYITPEKLRQSPKVTQILDRLYKDGQVARFVVDEAHCISTWGQDFREAYTHLGSLRDRYPTVPIMALTATANKRTRADIVAQLKLQPGHALFSQSFNRTNLKYFVRRKRGNVLNDLTTWLTTRYHNASGIIYCLSRKSCETVAQKLRDKGFTASHFHAGMSPAEREEASRDWQSGRVPIIVATIAFGMGIDKPDVRFVIHYDMPKTLSGYYQETGRAGRDGKPAECVMYFSIGDLKKLISQIKSTEGITQESKQRQEEAVRNVYRFCENTSECRRVQILQHFDERFDKDTCSKGCDTCQDNHETVSKDVTPQVLTILRMVQTVTQELNEKVTRPQLTNVLRGSKSAEIKSKNFDELPGHGSCKDLDSDLLELILNRLEFLEIIMSASESNKMRFHCEYLILGPKAHNIMQSGEPFVVDWHRKPDRVNNKLRKKATEQVESISAPVKSKKGKHKAIDDDPIEIFDDLYDMYDEPDVSYFATASSDTLVSSLSAPCVTAASSSSSSTMVDTMMVKTEETLYNDMLVLRREVKDGEGLGHEDDIFDDSVLQALSILCPTDYNAFKEVLTNYLDQDVPDIEELVKLKWEKYGQKFLQLCINHKTGMNSRPPVQSFSSVALHSKYDYHPPTSAAKVSTPQSAPRPKFKPS